LVDKLFKRLPGYTFIVDEPGCFVDCNDGFKRLVGMSDAEIRRHALRDLIAPRDHARVFAGIAQVLTDEEVTIECSMLARGREVPVQGSGSLVQIDEHPHVITTLFNVSTQPDLQANPTASSFTTRQDGSSMPIEPSARASATRATNWWG
jgi:PAS domain S-box-containing protein